MSDAGDIDEALERGYNVRAARTDFERIFAGWAERSETFRGRAGGFVDVAYGTAERQTLDIFAAATADAPTFVYLHGGYWQSGDKSAYSFIAEPFVDHEVSVVVMNYTLCPLGSVPGITEEIRRGLIWLYRNAGRYGLAGGRINVGGHSAGGHLTAMMLATNWNAHGPDLPADLVKTGIPLSGLYDLEPLRHTSINQAARIDEDAAWHCSPLFLQPRTGAPVLAAVGSRETAAFHEQTNDLVERWAAAGACMERHVVPEADHFDVVDRLADAGGDFFNRVLGLLRKG